MSLAILAFWSTLAVLVGLQPTTISAHTAAVIICVKTLTLILRLQSNFIFIIYYLLFSILRRAFARGKSFFF
jgi:hypothetical protein